MRKITNDVTKLFDAQIALWMKSNLCHSLWFPVINQQCSFPSLEGNGKRHAYCLCPLTGLHWAINVRTLASICFVRLLLDLLIFKWHRMDVTVRPPPSSDFTQFPFESLTHSIRRIPRKNIKCWSGSLTKCLEHTSPSSLTTTGDKRHTAHKYQNPETAKVYFPIENLSFLWKNAIWYATFWFYVACCTRNVRLLFGKSRVNSRVKACYSISCWSRFQTSSLLIFAIANGEHCPREKEREKKELPVSSLLCMHDVLEIVFRVSSPRGFSNSPTKLARQSSSTTIPHVRQHNQTMLYPSRKQFTTIRFWGKLCTLNRKQTSPKSFAQPKQLSQRNQLMLMQGSFQSFDLFIHN